ncbi:MAG: hypothetical protein HUU46_03665 [Candidatus Hydrogenedentes bacterium]|nr:hypothetical protein [Candidatus Hydrogenedentota bacterium]
MGANSGGGGGDSDFQQLVNKAMQELDSTKRSNAEAALPSATSTFLRRAILASAIIVSAGAWLFVIAYWLRASGSGLTGPNEVAARDEVEAIVAAEIRFRTNRYYDANNDGIADYGKLHQLVDPSGVGKGPALIDSVLASSEAHGYVFTVLTRDSAPGRDPTFKVIAAPLLTATNARAILADESGNVRTQDASAGKKRHDIAAE